MRVDNTAQMVLDVVDLTIRLRFDDPPECGVREPRRPLLPSLTGAATTEPSLETAKPKEGQVTCGE